jgi:hypothetical protein
VCKVSIYSGGFITRVNVNVKVLCVSLTVIILIILIAFILSKVLLKSLLGLLLLLFSFFLLSLFWCVVIRITSFFITDEALKLLSRVWILILTVCGSLVTIMGWVIMIIVAIVVPIYKESVGCRLLLLICNNR